MKLEPSEAKRVITDIAFDEFRISNQECDALRCGVQAINIVEKIKEIIREEEHYPVSNSLTDPHPNEQDYNKVHADKFKRIWKVISDAESN